MSDENSVSSGDDPSIIEAPMEAEESLSSSSLPPSNPLPPTANVEVQFSSNDRSVATFSFFDEDHTLGNSLRFILAQRPDVEFAGYSIPHPSENRLNLRLQTSGRDASEVIQEGLESLGSLCDIVVNKFEEEFEKFERKKGKAK